MNSKFFKEYKNLIITALQTIVFLIAAAALTFIKCGFSLKNFDWVFFICSFLFSTMMKMTYTHYAKQKALENEDIIILQEAIFEDKKEIYNAGKNKEFDVEIERINNVNLLDFYISELDEKKELNDYEQKTRKWAFDYKNALNKTSEKTIEEYEHTRSIKSIKLKKFSGYERIDSSKLFTYGRSNKRRRKKFSFSSLGSSLSRALIPTTLSLVFSLLLGLLDPDPSVSKGQMIIDFAGYLLSMILGIGWGLSNGKAIILEDYSEVLNNIASLVREVKTKILTKKVE